MGWLMCRPATAQFDLKHCPNNIYCPTDGRSSRWRPFDLLPLTHTFMRRGSESPDVSALPSAQRLGKASSVEFGITSSFRKGILPPTVAELLCFAKNSKTSFVLLLYFVISTPAGWSSRSPPPSAPECTPTLTGCC